MFVCVIGAVIGFLISASLNFGMWPWGRAILQFFPEWILFGLMAGLFAVVIPLIFALKTESRQAAESTSQIRQQSVFPHAPTWMIIFTMLIWLYTLVAGISRIIVLGSYYVEERNGVYVLTQSRKVVRELSEAE
jgi:hypothetical protein